MRHEICQEDGWLEAVQERRVPQHAASAVFFFPRMAAKSRHDQGDLPAPDVTAAEEQQQMDVTRQAILQEVQLRYPIVYDNLDICAMYKEERLKQLTITMLCIVCNYFDIATEGFNNKRKAEYVAALSELVLACKCPK